MQEYELMP